VDRLFGDLLQGVAEGKSGEDWKTRLQELVQTRLRQSPRYRVVSEEGPDHSKTFEVEVTVGTELFARARGRSKKEAEQAAARETLTMLDSEAKKDPAAR
jgi:ribonuclease-3